MELNWTEKEEDALLDYLRDEKNNKRFWKRNAEREKAFGDCAVFLTKRSEHRRLFKPEDVKAFCIYLVEKRYRLKNSSLSHLFRIGIFRKKNGEPCDIFTREECRELAEEDKAREEGRPIPKGPEETTALPLRISESVTRQGVRYKSRSPEIKDVKNPSNIARKRPKYKHAKAVDDFQASPTVVEEQDKTPSLPQALNHLMHKHQHMDGAEIRRKFAELEKYIIIAADSVSSEDHREISWNRLHHYGEEDVRLLMSIPIPGMIQPWDASSHFQIVRALIGLCVFRWIFEDPFAETELYGYPSREAMEAIWTSKCGQYDMRVLNPLYAILKDAYFWQTTQMKFLDVLLPSRSRKLSGRLISFLGTLFNLEVPRCATEHDSEQSRQKDCDLWPCQIEAVVFDALDLDVKIRQRDLKTVFRWPAMNDTFDQAFMQHEGDVTAAQRSDSKVKFTYMPAVIDRHDSQDPSAVDGGVWYKAVVGLG